MAGGVQGEASLGLCAPGHSDPAQPGESAGGSAATHSLIPSHTFRRGVCEVRGGAGDRKLLSQMDPPDLDSHMLTGDRANCQSLSEHRVQKGAVLGSDGVCCGASSLS